MRSIIVDGPARLSGSVHVPGAKNSVLPILAASLLCTGTVVLRNVPRLTDVQAALESYVAAQRSAFEQYLQDQYTIAQNAVIETLPGGEVMLVMSEDAAQTAQALRDALK